MQSGTIREGKQRALQRVPHLVLSVKHRETCAINVHGRVVLTRKTWSDNFAEDVLAFVPMANADASPLDPAAIAMTSTNEPLVHLHVDWVQINHVHVQTNPPNRIKCDARIVLAPSTALGEAAIAFYAVKGHLGALSSYGYDRWTALT